MGILFFLFIGFIALIIFICVRSSSKTSSVHYIGRETDYDEFDDDSYDYHFIREIEREDIEERNSYDFMKMGMDPYDREMSDMMYLDEDGELLDDL